MKNFRIPLAVALAAAFVAGAWMLVRPPELPQYSASAAALESTPEARARIAAPETKLGAASVLAIDPRGSSSKASAPMPL